MNGPLIHAFLILNYKGNFPASCGKYFLRNLVWTDGKYTNHQRSIQKSTCALFKKNINFNFFACKKILYMERFAIINQG